MAEKYSSGADTYPEVTKKALLEMQRQASIDSAPRKQKGKRE